MTLRSSDLTGRISKAFKPPEHAKTHYYERILRVEIRLGNLNRGLSPKFSEKIGGTSFLENRAFSELIGAFGASSGLHRTDSSAPQTHGGRAEIAPKGPFLAQLAPEGLLSPRLDLPDKQSQLQCSGTDL